MTTWAEMLRRLPTISASQACDLKVDDGEHRVWLSRCGIEDGEPFENTVYVERNGALDGHRMGGWYDAGHADGDDPDPHRLAGEMGKANAATRRALDLLPSDPEDDDGHPYERFTLTLEVGNAAFHPDPIPEVVRLLRQTADRMEDGSIFDCNLTDDNGNTVGRYWWEV